MSSEQNASGCECADVPSLISTTLHLMSAFSATRCPRLAIMIKRHLEKLARHPDTDPLVRGTSVRLIEQCWAATEISAREILSSDQDTAVPPTKAAPNLKLVH